MTKALKEVGVATLGGTVTGIVTGVGLSLLEEPYEGESGHPSPASTSGKWGAAKEYGLFFGAVFGLLSGGSAGLGRLILNLVGRRTASA